MNILVRNLSSLLNVEKLVSVFRPFGKVSSVRIVRDKKTGHSIGIGFIEMPDQAEGTAAIKALHRTELFQESIRVKEAKPKFGPAYFAENPEMIVEIFRPGPAAPVDQSLPNSKKPAYKREVDGAFGKRPGARKSGSERPRFSHKEGTSPEYKPRGERNYSPRGTGERGSRPYSKYPPREGGRPEYKPRGERSFSPHSSGVRGSHPYSKYPPREGARPEYKPRGERPYAPREPSPNSDQPYSRYRGVKGSSSEKKYQGGRSFRPHSSGERKPRPRFR